jgi:hypothetical protein
MLVHVSSLQRDGLNETEKIFYKCVSQLNFTSIVLLGIGYPFSQQKVKNIVP